MAEKYTTQTASLKATTADIRVVNAKNLDAQKIRLNGQDIEELLGSVGSNITIEDGREIKTRYDIWEHAAVENEDGSITVKNLYVPDASGWINEFKDEINSSEYYDSSSLPRNVIDNKVYLGNTNDYGDIRTRPELVEVWANMDTSNIVNGERLFSNEEYND